MRAAVLTFESVSSTGLWVVVVLSTEGRGRRVIKLTRVSSHSSQPFGCNSALDACCLGSQEGLEYTSNLGWGRLSREALSMRL